MNHKEPIPAHISDEIEKMEKFYKEAAKNFPKAGDKLIFKGVPEFYYPMFINMGTLARKVLVIGREYTIRKIEIYSSWCCVWLEDVDGDGFNLSFFKKELM